MLVIDSDGSSLFIFEEKWLNDDAAGPKTTPNSTKSLVMDGLCYRLLHDDVRILWSPNMTILLHIATEVKMSFVRKDDFSVKMLIFNQVQPIGRTKNASCGINSCTNWTLYGFIPRSLFKILLKEVREMFKFWERWWVDVGCSSTLWATAAMFSVDLTGARERVALFNKDPVCRIRFTNWSTALKAFLFYQIFHINFL